jgi:hypothetical protein
MIKIRVYRTMLASTLNSKSSDSQMEEWPDAKAVLRMDFPKKTRFSYKKYFEGVV